MISSATNLDQYSRDKNHAKSKGLRNRTSMKHTLMSSSHTIPINYLSWRSMRLLQLDPMLACLWWSTADGLSKRETKSPKFRACARPAISLALKMLDVRKCKIRQNLSPDWALDRRQDLQWCDDNQRDAAIRTWCKPRDPVHRSKKQAVSLWRAGLIRD